MTQCIELIARLRDTASKGVSVWGDLQIEAAKELEIVTAEREAYASAIDRMQSAIDALTAERDGLQAQLAAAQGQSHDIAVGVLYDFMGWLTTRGEKLVLSSTDSAAPAADAIRDFTKMRNVSSENPLIKTWHTTRQARAAHQDGIKQGGQHD